METYSGKNNKFDFPSIVDEYDDSLSMMVSKISFTKTTGTYYTITLNFLNQKQNYKYIPLLFY